MLSEFFMPLNSTEFVATGSPPLEPLGGERVSLSLSIGTLKSSSNLTNTHTPATIINTMTKEYPRFFKFYRFKKPLKIGQQTEEKGSTEHLKVEKTPEEKEEIREGSIRRTRAKMKDIVDSNDFDKFATLTFDPKKHEATNKDYVSKKITNFLNGQQKAHGSFRYLLVLEPMKDGKIHAHALLGGFTGKYHPTNKRGKGKNQRQAYKIDAWEKNYGFGDMEDITNKDAVASYIGKYITKDIDLVGEGKKRYWSSKNLVQPKKTYNTTVADALTQTKLDLKKLTEYENDFVEIVTIPKKT